MSDHYWVIVDRDATAVQHQELIEKVLNWLATQKIVEPERSNCVLGKDEFGYKPGPCFLAASSEKEDHTVTNLSYEGMLTGGVNGLQVVTERRVYLDYSDDVGQGICGACGAKQAESTAWNAAAQAWFDGDDTAHLRCDQCGTSIPVTEWTYEPPMSFGTLGFLFWNWPLPSDAFPREFERVLGHRVATIFCHI